MDAPGQQVPEADSRGGNGQRGCPVRSGRDNKHAHEGLQMSRRQLLASTCAEDGKEGSVR